MNETPPPQPEPKSPPPEVAPPTPPEKKIEHAPQSMTPGSF